MLRIVFVVLCFNVFALGQSEVAKVSGLGSTVRFDVGVPHAAVTLSVSTPDGEVITKEFQSGNTAEFKLIQKGERLPDGQYTYELRVTPNISAEVKEALKAARAKDNAREVQRDMRKRGVLPQALVQSGSFTILNGSAIVAGAGEERVGTARVTAEPPAAPVAPAVSSGRMSYKVQRHHPRFMMFDQVIPDDLIVQGSGCFGFDCVNNENFGFDTIRLKENNLRIGFDDTSSSAGFATNNWQIRANDSTSGGANFLGFVDLGATGTSDGGNLVFAVDAGAPANSIRTNNIGKVGFRTATPVLDLHMNTSDTPAVRFEQNNTGGFSAQTWDIGANEANFFVRDVTGGSRLSLRIRPGAPTSSLDISASGNVGLGTASPNLRAEVFGAAGLPVASGTTPTGIARFSQSGGLGVIDLGFGGASGAGWVQSTSSGNLATNFAFLINPNGGNVGINTSSPTDALSVNGNASKTTGGTWAVFSDVRLKRINGAYNSGLKAVMQLQPLRFNYRPENGAGIKSDGEHVGFAAQEVQKVIPEAVMKSSNGYLMVNSDPILWAMLNAIKEQQKEIVELKRQVRQLRSTARRRK